MYQNKLAAAIKVNGRILREHAGSVAIPFGSEYTLFFKNLNSVRVKVQVSIDGTDATGGTWLVVGPNSTLELERFIRNGNFSEGNRFKFIERSADVEVHRGMNVDDGLVRIESATERRVVDVPIVNYYDEWYPRPFPQRPSYDRRRPYFSGGLRGSGKSARMTASASSGRPVASQHREYAVPAASMGGGASAGAYSDTTNDVGITVAGGVSHQSFQSVADFPTDQSDVMILHLKGVIAGSVVQEPVTVQTKLTCSSCGKLSASSVEFCDRCGTALTLR